MNQLLDAFTDAKKVIKSYTSATNTPTQIDVCIGSLTNIIVNESKDD